MSRLKLLILLIIVAVLPLLVAITITFINNQKIPQTQLSTPPPSPTPITPEKVNFIPLDQATRSGFTAPTSLPKIESGDSGGEVVVPSTEGESDHD